MCLTETIENHVRTLCLRRDAGRWIANPQDVYDAIRNELKQCQVPIPELFWCNDEKEHLGLGFKGCLGYIIPNIAVNGIMSKTTSLEATFSSTGSMQQWVWY